MTHGGDAVAIVGMAGRFPDAGGLDEFWSNLREGVESLRYLSDDDLAECGVPDQVSQNPNYVRFATVLDGADQFDADFFGYSPREAEIMDPQQRLFLESAWSAMEDAGYPPGDPQAVVGVYASVSLNSYQNQVIYRNPEVAMGAGGYQLMLGNDKDFLSTRVSYKLNLRGPSMVVQTACSSSLVAVDVAVKSLLCSQCDMAIVGGASLTLPQTSGYLFQEGMIFSPDGHCRPFDKDAGGIRAGHGAGAVVLKRLKDALADEDRIRAVILGSAINNDGAGKIGYTAPSIEGQSEVIAQAQALAGAEPDSIDYVEAHGTGTRLGDPIEVAALSQVFRKKTEKRQFCGIGSLKSNLGHLDAAAGIASLIKTVLSLENKQIPPTLNYSAPNPEIDFEASPFFVNDTLRDWSSDQGPRRAGVSSFGIGGTNAHVILEESPSREPATASGGDQLIVLSAANSDALDQATLELGSFLASRPEVDLPDVAFTSQVGRASHLFRRILVAESQADAAEVLSGEGSPRVLSGKPPEAPGPVAYMFSGQGSQYPKMGLGLYRRFPEFRDEVDHCAEHLKTLIQMDIRDLILDPEDAEAAAEALQETRLTQPALFVVEYALAKLWMAWGIVPDSMIGHSIGEWVAAHLAGVFSLEDALGLVAERGRLMQEQPSGVMFSVSLPEQEVRGLIEGNVCIAATNSPSLCTLSGSEEEMAALAESFQARDVPFRPLHTSHAFHSEMMDPVVPVFLERVAEVRRDPPEIPFISNVTGTWITDEQAVDPGYWAGQIRAPVRFLDGIRELNTTANRLFLEVGPGQALTTFTRQSVDLGAVGRIVPSLPHARDTLPADRFILEALGRLWMGGAEPNWKQIHGAESPKKTGIPTYPFQRKRYWVEPSGGGTDAPQETGISSEPAEWFYTPTWTRTSILKALLLEDSDLSDPWLVFENGSDLSTGIVEELRGRGVPVSTVSVGDVFSRDGNDGFTLNPQNREDYEELFKHLGEEERLPFQILHLWTGPGQPNDEGSLSEPGLERSQALGFFSLVYLSQALGRVGPLNPVQVTVVSTGMTSVYEESEVTRPENATLLGPCSVLPLEAPWIDCRLVDLRDEATEDPTRIRDALIREALFPRPATLVAYRGDHRWERSFEALHLKENDPHQATPLSDTGSVYLITGGLGALGRAFARHLASRGPCVLALLGRSQFPIREQWDELLEANPPSPWAEAIQDLRSMEELGATVLPFSADAADEGRMSQLFQEIEEGYGRVTGIIHAAGVPATGILQLKTPELAKSVLDPKVKGALILDSLVGEDPLEFFVLFSSINAVLPAGGGSDYCGANAFLDAFASYRRGKGDGRAMSLAWDTWREVGMAVDTEVPAELQAAKDASLLTGLSTLEGMGAFDRAQGSNLPHVIISRQSLLALFAAQSVAKMQLRSIATGDGLAGEAIQAAQGTSSKHQRPDLPQAYLAPRNEGEEMIAQVWQELLGIEPIGVNDNFFELGGHSLLAVRVLAYLQESIGLSLTLEAIFEAPTIAELAEQIETLQWMASGEAESEDLDEEREEFVI